MAEQKVDTDALRTMTETLQTLIDYTQDLRDASQGFAYSLPAEWQGPAMARFIASFETWAVTAEGLRQQSEMLKTQADAALAAYEATIDATKTSWSEIQSSLA
jgi:uncharacterized protein YukE